jgi:hypothetical protein
MLVLYHRTTDEAARAIMRGGFRDHGGCYMTARWSEGVWVSVRPLGVDEGAKGERLIRIVLRDASLRLIARYEWVEAGKPHREWQVPARVVNCGWRFLYPGWRGR